MVMMRGGLNEKVFAHCMGAGINPRVTITTHIDNENRLVWYLGGQLAEDGVRRSDDEQITRARQELAQLLPWQNLDAAQWAILDIDRAEVRHEDGHRPDTFYIDQQGDIITAWPTKLALAPLLAGELVELLATVEKTESALPAWLPPPFADYPWDEHSRWDAA